MKEIKRHKLPYLLLSLLAVVWLYPFGWLLVASVKNNQTFFATDLNLWLQEFSFKNYQRAWLNADFGRYFKNTVTVTVAVIAIVLLITVLAGYVFARFPFKGKRFFMGVMMAGMSIPAVITLIPIYEILKQLQLSHRLLGLILAEAGIGNVIFLVLFAQFFQQIPRELEEAALLDGCGFYRLFFSVMLPLAKPMIATVVIMQFIWTWNSFMLPLVLTLNTPKNRTVAVGLYALKGENVVDWAGISAGAVISIVPSIIIFLLFQNYFVNGLAGAIKE